MQCQFNFKDGKCVCVNCGFSDTYSECHKMHRNCPGIVLAKGVEQDRGCGNCKEPSLIQKAKNFASALTDHIKAGLPVVSDEVQQRRIKICEGCPLFNLDHRTCTVCGCAMDEKTRWAEQQCAKALRGEEPLWKAEV